MWVRNNDSVPDRIEWPWMRRPPRVWYLAEMCLCGESTCDGRCPFLAYRGTAREPFRADACKLAIHHMDILIDERRDYYYVFIVEATTYHNDFYQITYIHFTMRLDETNQRYLKNFIFPSCMQSELQSLVSALPIIFCWGDTHTSGWIRRAEKRRYQARTFTFVLCLLKRLGFCKDLRSLIAGKVFKKNE